jgi:hypothetical protein
MAEFKINGTLNTTKGVKTKGTNYILVSASGTATENATELQAAYTAAQTMSPSSGNCITIVASPGYYEFNSDDFIMNQEYIDIVSLDGNRSIKIIGSYTISVTTNNVYVNGVDTGTLPFKIDSGLSITIENCKGGDYSFGYDAESTIDISSKFIDCEAGSYSFAYTEAKNSPATASGTFIRCTASNYSFGSGDSDNIASGIFIDCTAGNYSFGANPRAVASGQFTRCIAGDYSFGDDDASGVFMYCQGGQESFGKNAGNGGAITGKLYYCRKTTGDFTEVSGSGITRLCIDGNNAENNQG